MKTLMMAALAAFVTLGTAQTPGGRGPGPGRGEGLREKLNLSDEAAGKIDQLGDEHRKNQIALRAKLAAARVEFRSLMRQDTPDEKLAMAKQKEMSAIREELQAARLAHRFAVSKLLTPEQRKMLKERPGRGFGMREHRGPGFGMGDDGGGGCCDNDRPMKHRRGSHRHRHRMDGRGRR